MYPSDAFLLKYFAISHSLLYFSFYTMCQAEGRKLKEIMGRGGSDGRWSLVPAGFVGLRILAIKTGNG